VILPGGRDLQQPWSLCAEAEASRDTFSALDDGILPSVTSRSLPAHLVRRCKRNVSREGGVCKIKKISRDPFVIVTGQPMALPPLLFCRNTLLCVYHNPRREWLSLCVTESFAMRRCCVDATRCVYATWLRCCVDATVSVAQMQHDQVSVMRSSVSAFVVKTTTNKNPM
jgi:hypothetical protein